SSGAARIFLRHAFATSNASRLGACNETWSRVRSSNKSATMAEASTTLAVTVFADQPRRLVAALEAELADSGRDLLDRKLARRRPGRLLNERAQFALQRAMIGLGALAQPRHLLLRHAFDRQVHGSTGP